MSREGENLHGSGREGERRGAHLRIVGEKDGDGRRDEVREGGEERAVGGVEEGEAEGGEGGGAGGVVGGVRRLAGGGGEEGSEVLLQLVVGGVGGPRVLHGRIVRRAPEFSGEKQRRRRRRPAAGERRGGLSPKYRGEREFSSRRRRFWTVRSSCLSRWRLESPANGRSALRDSALNFQSNEKYSGDKTFIYVLLTIKSKG